MNIDGTEINPCDVLIDLGRDTAEAEGMDELDEAMLLLEWADSQRAWLGEYEV